MQIEDARKYISEAFHEYVPASGKCETLYGELVRAINRVGYRWYNDGDMLGVGYGRETCNPAGRFIIENTNDDIGNAVSSMWGLSSEDEYESKLKDLIVKLADYLKEHEDELLSKETKDMFESRDQYEDVDDYDDDYEDDDYDDDYEDDDYDDDYEDDDYDDGPDF